MAISEKFMKGNFINRTTNPSRVNFGFGRMPLKSGGKVVNTTIEEWTETNFIC